MTTTTTKNTACSGDEIGGRSTTDTTSTSRAARDGGGVIVSMGNDHALYLAPTDVSFGCEDVDMPTSAPSSTSSSPPGSSTFPTPIFTEGGSIGPTIVDSTIPTIFATTAPSVLTDTQTSNGVDGRCGLSSMGFLISCLQGVALSLIWHRF
ncbi:hypothetical protein ACHAXA_007104 [Cyclostephanos tholiformis]|uniref:Uncharacterized protein n=1 Tax=Cyclostephanos tholiformis TaxID=382380 RepID=A0ABD3RZ39_9STRA